MDCGGRKSPSVQGGKVLKCFWCGQFLLSLLDLSQYCFCVMLFCFLGRKAGGIKTCTLALEGKVLANRPPGKSPGWRCLYKHCVSTSLYTSATWHAHLQCGHAPQPRFWKEMHEVRHKSDLQAGVRPTTGLGEYEINVCHGAIKTLYLFVMASYQEKGD